MKTKPALATLLGAALAIGALHLLLRSPEAGPAPDSEPRAASAAAEAPAGPPPREPDAPSGSPLAEPSAGPAPSQALAGTARMVQSHATLRQGSVNDPDSQENLGILQAMAAKALAAPR